MLGISMGHKSHSPDLQTRLAGTHPQALAALSTDCSGPSIPRAWWKPGSESRHASLCVLQFLISARHSQQLPDRAVGSGKHEANLQIVNSK